MTANSQQTLTTLLDGGEYWVTYHRLFYLFKRFDHKSLRSIHDICLTNFIATTKFTGYYNAVYDWAILIGACFHEERFCCLKDCPLTIAKYNYLHPICPTWSCQSTVYYICWPHRFSFQIPVHEIRRKRFPFRITLHDSFHKTSCLVGLYWNNEERETKSSHFIEITLSDVMV